MLFRYRTTNRIVSLYIYPTMPHYALHSRRLTYLCHDITGLHITKTMQLLDRTVPYVAKHQLYHTELNIAVPIHDDTRQNDASLCLAATPQYDF